MARLLPSGHVFPRPAIGDLPDTLPCNSVFASNGGKSFAPAGTMSDCGDVGLCQNRVSVVGPWTGSGPSQPGAVSVRNILCVTHPLEVLWSVIGAIAVNVVHAFAPTWWLTEEGPGDKSMNPPKGLDVVLTQNHLQVAASWDKFSDPPTVCPRGVSDTTNTPVVGDFIHTLKTAYISPIFVCQFHSVKLAGVTAYV